MASALYVNRQAFLIQIQLIEANCEKEVARQNDIRVWPKWKVCEVTNFDIVTEVSVRLGKHSRMECGEIIWALSSDIVETCEFIP